MLSLEDNICFTVSVNLLSPPRDFLLFDKNCNNKITMTVNFRGIQFVFLNQSQIHT